MLAVATMLAFRAIDGEAPRAQAGTVFGATITGRPGESVDEAIARVEQEIGPPPIVRLYSAEGPPAWSDIKAEVGKAAVVVSFKYDPAAVVSGAADERLTRWFRAAPDDRDVYWVYYHEPENNVESGEFTAGEFQAAWLHVDALARGVENPNLHSTLVLMCWTLDESSGRRWVDYVPTNHPPEVLAWDCYNREAKDGRYSPPDLMFKSSAAVSSRVRARWAIAELGSELAVGDDGRGRAGWLVDVAEYARAHHAAFVTYFHALYDGEYELSDSASQDAWRRIMAD